MISGPDVALLVAAEITAGHPCPNRTSAILGQTWPSLNAENTPWESRSPVERRQVIDRRSVGRRSAGG
jgi:hypothetical protein